MIATTLFQFVVRRTRSLHRGGAEGAEAETKEPIRKIIETGLLKVGKDPAFRKDWEDVVLDGNAFEQMVTGKEFFEDVRTYTD